MSVCLSALFLPSFPPSQPLSIPSFLPSTIIIANRVSDVRAQRQQSVLQSVCFGEQLHRQEVSEIHINGGDSDDNGGGGRQKDALAKEHCLLQMGSLSATDGRATPF